MMMDNNHRNPKIRLRFAQVDVQFLSNGVRGVDDTPHMFLLAHLDHLFPGHQHPRIGHNAVDYRNDLLLLRFAIGTGERPEVRAESGDNAGVRGGELEREFR